MLQSCDLAMQSRIESSTKGKRTSWELHRPTKRRSLNRNRSKAAAASQQFEMLEEEFLLPDDMIMEILLRLPVRSLLQFKCVCKSWKTLISDPQFAKHHLRYSTADPTNKHLRLAFWQHSGIIMSLPVKPLFDNNKSPTPPQPIIRKSPEILGSCNGLLCLHDYRKVTLWNPSTRLMSKTSLPIFENDPPTRKVTNAGFGYDQLNDKYKLIMMLQFGPPTQKLIKIYTFDATNNSSAITICNFPPPNTTIFHGKFVSGTLNWIVTGGVVESHLSKYKWTIFWFDLEKDTFHEMLLPKQLPKQHSEPALSVLNNSLCVSFYDSYQTHWVLWSMKKHGVAESWTKLFTIPLINIYDEDMDLFCISNSGVLFGLCRDLFLYDSINGRLESTFLNKNGKYCVLSQWIYHESLIPPPC